MRLCIKKMTLLILQIGIKPRLEVQKFTDWLKKSVLSNKGYCFT